MSDFREQTLGCAVGLNGDARDPGEVACPENRRREEHEVPPAPTPRGNVARWLLSGSGGLLEQAFHSGANFIPNVVLARSLVPHEFGAFSVGFTVICFGEVINYGLIYEPMFVFSKKYYEARAEAYLRNLLNLQLWSAAMMTGVLALAGLVSGLLGDRALALTFVAFAVACPMLQYRMFMRMVCALNLNYRVGASCSGFHLLSVSCVVLGLSALGIQAAWAVIVLLGLSNLVSGLWLGWGIGFPAMEWSRGPFWRSVLNRHLRYAGWGVGARVLNGVNVAAPNLVLSYFAGLGASGAFRAMFNLIMPFLSLNVALIPMFVSLFRKAETAPAFDRLVIRLLLIVLAPTVLSWAILVFAGPMLLDLLYRGKYSSEASILWIYGALPVAILCAAVFDCVFLTRESPRVLFLANLLGVALNCTIGIPMIAWLGIKGAVLSMVLVFATNLGALALVYCFHRPAIPAQPGMRDRNEGGRGRDPSAGDGSVRRAGRQECHPSA